MSFDQIVQVAGSEIVFAVLFIFLFIWVTKKSANDEKAHTRREEYIMTLHKQREEDLKEAMTEHRKDSLAREAELMGHMRSMVDQQEVISNTLKEVSIGVEMLEKKVDNNVLEIWKVVAKKNTSE